MQLSDLKNLQLNSVISPAVLDLHILSTEKCNFRCVYCYEDFHIGKMRPATIQSVKNFISKRMPELKQLRISWFGGEPLAAIDVVYDISQYAKSCADQQSCSYHFGMTTNGYLLNAERFATLISLGFSTFQISLDGPKTAHDKTRLRADGAGTFDKIWSNLLHMAKTNYAFEVILRVHVTPQNYLEIPELIELINYHFKNDSRFKIFLKAIANLGGPNAGSFDVLSGKTKEEIMLELKGQLAHGVAQHELHKQGLPYICYASAQNAWVIRADGTLAKCTVAFYDDRNKVGHLNADGTLTLDQTKIQLWLRGLKNGDAGTLSCPAYRLPKLVIPA